MKSDKATVRLRTNEVLALRLHGAEFMDIRQHAADQGWNVSDRQLFRYIAAGDALLAETLERDREKLLNRHIAQRRALFARAMAVSDYGTALRVLNSEAEMLNLFPAKRTEVTSKDAAPSAGVSAGDVQQAVIDALREEPDARVKVAQALKTLYDRCVQPSPNGAHP
jgi:predicted DNA-binding protein (UPF0251 family)